MKSRRSLADSEKNPNTEVIGSQYPDAEIFIVFSALALSFFTFAFVASLSWLAEAEAAFPVDLAAQIGALLAVAGSAGEIALLTLS